MAAMRDERRNAWQEGMTACQDAMETNPRKKKEKKTDKMSRRATVARRMRDIVKKNLTQGAGGFPRKRLVMADKMTRCANVAQHKRLRSQGNQLKSSTSPYKDVSKKTQEKLECGRTTDESAAKGREIERFKFERDTRKQMTKQSKACASAQGNMLHIKNWTLWRGRPPRKWKRKQRTEDKPAM
jgi:hypothetical protein